MRPSEPAAEAWLKSWDSPMSLLGNTADFVHELLTCTGDMPADQMTGRSRRK